MVSLNYQRQMDVIGPSELRDAHVTLIGAGGIGSPTALVLAKMGIPRIRVIDADLVESQNIPVTIYRPADLGKAKVEALASIVEAHTECQIFYEPVMYTGQALQGIVVSAVDSKEVRRTIWENIRMNIDVPIYIDGRMAAQMAKVYSIKPNFPEHIRFYEPTLEGEGYAEACTNRAIIYNVFMIASLICAQVKRYLKGEEMPIMEVFDFATRTFITN